MLQKLFRLVVLSGLLISPTLAIAEGESFPIKLSIMTNLPTKADTSYGISVFIDGDGLIGPNAGRSGGMGNQGQFDSRLGVGFFGNTEATVLLFHSGSQQADLSNVFCALHIELNQGYEPSEDTVKKVKWLKKETAHPWPQNKTKPAKCSVRYTPQDIKIFINYSGEPE